MLSSEASQGIEKALTQNLNFYAVRYPGEKEVIFNCTGKILSGITDIDGFVIAPFDNNPDNIFTIPSDPICTERLLKTDNLQNRLSLDGKEEGLKYPLPDKSTTFEEHQFEVNSIVSRLKKSGESHKTVAARVLIQDCKRSAGKIFTKLCNIYPSANILFFHSSGSGSWKGSSPKMLLTITGNTLTTKSLAGTRPADTPGEWDDKNKEEQRIVSRYIADLLSRLGLTLEITDPITKKAGPIEHLQTLMSAKLPDNISIPLLVKQITGTLSPTPALCGFPKDEALTDILRLENFSRGYYGGYAGLIDKFGVHLFVNLRSCMLTKTEKLILFAGGGIMADSIPSAEWEETERKLSTLLDILPD